MQARRPAGEFEILEPRRETRADLKLLAIMGAGVSGAVCATGIAAGGVEGGAYALVGAIASVALLAYVFAPARPVYRGDRAVAERFFLTKLVFAAFAVRLVCAWILHMGDAWRSIGGDEGTFHGNASLNTLWLRQDILYRHNFKFQDTHEVGYIYLLTSIYYTFGISKFIPLVLNAAVGACIVYPVHSLAGRWGGRIAARRAALVVAFFPSLILWSSLMVRDVMMLFFIIACLWTADELRRRFRVGTLVALAGCIAAMATLRTYIAALVTVAVAISLLMGRKSTRQSLWIGGLVIVGVVVAVRQTGVGLSEAGRANLEYLAMMRTFNAMGVNAAGSLGTDVDISTPTKALVYLPEGLLYFYLSPLPWQISSSRQVFAILDLLVWYPMLFAGLWGAVWLVRRRLRAALPLLLVVVGISVLYALVEGNIGIIFRHRGQIVVPFCVLAGVGFALRKRAAAREAKARGRPVPLDASPAGALRPAPGL
jgi:hypothetical protein